MDNKVKWSTFFTSILDFKDNENNKKKINQKQKQNNVISERIVYVTIAGTKHAVTDKAPASRFVNARSAGRRLRLPPARGHNDRVNKSMGNVLLQTVRWTPETEIPIGHTPKDTKTY